MNKPGEGKIVWGKKPDWLYRQSAAVPFLVENGEVKVVLITSMKSKKWIVPKGVVEPGLSPQDSAANEALEEAGLHGMVDEAPMGCYEYEKWGGTCKVQVFAFRVEKILDEWLEMDSRQREIVPIDQALDRIKNRELADIIKKHVEKEKIS
jgi:8-oxo-dGTP pyrophosphatase MutT (NUDIX family)